MMYKRSSTIIFSYQADKMVCFNYLLNKKTEVSNKLIAMLEKINDWQSIEDLSKLFGFNENRELTQLTLDYLVEYGILVKKNTKQALSQKEFEMNWKWGEQAALYICCLNFTKFGGYDKNLNLYSSLKNKVEKLGDVSLFHSNVDFKVIISEEKPNLTSGLMEIMSSRRTVRFFDQAKPISKSELFDVLFSGLGVLSFREAPPFSRLPLKMTPSGGARNPYDAIVYCSNIIGIKKGIYKYSPVEHSLGLLTDKVDVEISTVLGGQEWINNAPAVIFLVADVMRTMYKYEHYSAYRVILIEAGHIAQNMGLTARNLGFFNSTTAAVDNSALTKMIDAKENNIFSNSVYAIALGHLDQKNSDLNKQ